MVSKRWPHQVLHSQKEPNSCWTISKKEISFSTLRRLISWAKSSRLLSKSSFQNHRKSRTTFIWAFWLSRASISLLFSSFSAYFKLDQCSLRTESKVSWTVNSQSTFRKPCPFKIRSSYRSLSLHKPHSIPLRMRSSARRHNRFPRFYNLTSNY